MGGHSRNHRCILTRKSAQAYTCTYVTIVVRSLAGQTFDRGAGGRERLVTVVDFPCAIAECCDYQSDCSSHVTI